MFDLKKFRSINNLTQTQLAKYLDVTQAYLSQIERGLLELPKEYISKIKADGIYQMEEVGITSVDDSTDIEPEKRFQWLMDQAKDMNRMLLIALEDKKKVNEIMAELLEGNRIYQDENKELRKEVERLKKLLDENNIDYSKKAM